jgi:predicted RNA-binding Zn ribbon-like protein
MPQFATLANSQRWEATSGDLSLDFVNTGQWNEAGPWPERLQRFRDLVRWARDVGTLDPERSSRLLEAGERHPHRSQAAFERALKVRRVLHTIFESVAAQRSPAQSDLRLLDDELAAAFAAAHLEYCDGHIVRAWSDDAEDFGEVLRPIVSAATDLLLDARVTRLRSCASPQCGRLFLDESRNGMRRWCDMQVCGSRAKARRYYERRVERDA